MFIWIRLADLKHTSYFGEVYNTMTHGQSLTFLKLLWNKQTFEHKKKRLLGLDLDGKPISKTSYLE